MITLEMCVLMVKNLCLLVEMEILFPQQTVLISHIIQVVPNATLNRVPSAFANGIYVISGIDAILVEEVAASQTFRSTNLVDWEAFT